MNVKTVKRELSFFLAWCESHNVEPNAQSMETYVAKKETPEFNIGDYVLVSYHHGNLIENIVRIEYGKPHWEKEDDPLHPVYVFDGGRVAYECFVLGKIDDRVLYRNFCNANGFDALDAKALEAYCNWRETQEGQYGYFK